MEYPPVYHKHQKVLIVSDNNGYSHGVGDGREVKIMNITPIAPKNIYEYEVMDINGDFWHIPEGDLL